MIFRVVLIMFMFTITAPSAHASAQKAWVLTQDTNMGVVKMYLCQQAFRADVPEKGFSMISRAPNWRVVAFRNSDKLQFERPLASWAEHGLIWSSYGPTAQPDVRKATRVRLTYEGLPAYKVISTQREKSPGYGSLSGKYRISENILGTELICTDKIAVPVAVTNFVRGIYNLPKCDGLPLAYVMSTDDGRHTVFFTKLLSKNLFRITSSIARPDLPPRHGSGK